ncbi:MAG: pyrroline-5-carboxylate reductase [Lachnospiraceae bacterium]|nr:pyrroline-5-carboxylate reductase [Lachnospiraceae bacterium]
MKLGIIGFGNMAEAILGGVLKNNFINKEDAVASGKDDAMLKKASDKYGIGVEKDNCKVVEASDVILLSVKPQILEEVINEIKEVCTQDKLIISIVAGKTQAWIEEAFGCEHKVVRCMPNTPALIGEGCTGICFSGSVTAEEKDFALKMLNCVGKAIEVPEKLMDVVVGVSGSAPAYVFMFIEAMADGAVAMGMPRAQAYEFAAQAVMGSAKLMLETGKHPGELKDMVCSPGGTTIEAVRVLEEKGMRSAVMDAVIRCTQRSKEL